MRISIIIPTHNRAEIFNECLNSVLESISTEDEIIVINDFKNAKLRIDEHPQISIYDNPKQGVASARNLGASIATGKVLLFIDDDMLINKNALDKCLAALHETNNSVINSDWIYPPTETERLKKIQFGRFLINSNFTSLEGWCAPMKWEKHALLLNSGITSQFLMLYKSDYLESGGYNDAFPFAGFEDYDLGVKLMKNGLKCYINTNCIVFHNEIDRMTLEGYLDRKFRGAITRQKAVELGYTELKIDYSKRKELLYRLLAKIERPLRTSLKIIPNLKILDGIYNFVIKKLIGINIFNGYYNEK